MNETSRGEKAMIKRRVGAERTERTEMIRKKYGET